MCSCILAGLFVKIDAQLDTAIPAWAVSNQGCSMMIEDHK